MMENSHLSDETLLDILGAALAKADPVPANVVDNAKSACDWADIDLELAALTYDSFSNPAGVRSADTDRQLNFEAAETEIVILVAGRDGTFAIEGQIIPAGPTLVELVHPEMSISAHTRDLGRFSLVDVPGGRVQLRVTSRQLITEHFTL